MCSEQPQRNCAAPVHHSEWEWWSYGGVQRAGRRVLQTAVCVEAGPGRELFHALAFLASHCIASSSDCLLPEDPLLSFASYPCFSAAHSRRSILLCWEGISCNFLMSISSLFFLCLSWLWLFSGAGYRWIFVILTAMRRFWKGY